MVVRVHAAGCGPDVWHVMTGLPYFARLGLGLRRPKLPTRGWDVAGTVEAVGRSVQTMAPGDEVLGVADGSFAALARARAEKLVAKPARLTFEQAAATPVSGLTALQALRDVADLQPGQRVLVIGAAGGVGTFAVQIAKALGAQVTAVCSTSKLDLARSIGADDALDYTREDFTDGTRRWDVIVDTAGRRPLSTLRQALAPAGVLVIVGGDGGGRWTGGFFRGMLRAPLLSLFVGQKLPRTDFQGAAGRPPRPGRPHRDRPGHTRVGPHLPAGRRARRHSLPGAGTPARQDRHHHPVARRHAHGTDMCTATGGPPATRLDDHQTPNKSRSFTAVRRSRAVGETRLQDAISGYPPGRRSVLMWPSRLAPSARPPPVESCHLAIRGPRHHRLIGVSIRPRPLPPEPLRCSRWARGTSTSPAWGGRCGGIRALLTARRSSDLPAADDLAPRSSS